MTNKEKFLALVSDDQSKTVERAKARVDCRKFSRLSNLIAFKILERLDELGWKQIHFAEKMNVSPQQVNKWVKGKENFTIETLVNMGEILGIELIQVNDDKVKEQVQNSKIYLSEDYSTPKIAVRVHTKLSITDDSAYENTYALAN